MIENEILRRQCAEFRSQNQSIPSKFEENISLLSCKVEAVEAENESLRRQLAECKLKVEAENESLWRQLVEVQNESLRRQLEETADRLDSSGFGL